MFVRVEQVAEGFAVELDGDHGDDAALVPRRHVRAEGRDVRDSLRVMDVSWGLWTVSWGQTEEGRSDEREGFEKSSLARGISPFPSTPRAPPSMVCVFPAPLCPYAMTVALIPRTQTS